MTQALQQATGRNVKVAVVDSGINAHHSHVQQVSGGVSITCDASGEIAFNDDYRDYDGHGTAVAGIIRSKAPDVELYSVKILQDRLRTESRVLAAAIRSCIANDIRMINMSLGTHQISEVDSLRQACEAAAERTLFLSPQAQRSASFRRAFLVSSARAPMNSAAGMTMHTRKTAKLNFVLTLGRARCAARRKATTCAVTAWRPPTSPPWWRELWRLIREQTSMRFERP